MPLVLRIHEPCVTVGYSPERGAEKEGLGTRTVSPNGFQRPMYDLPADTFKQASQSPDMSLFHQAAQVKPPTAGLHHECRDFGRGWSIRLAA